MKKTDFLKILLLALPVLAVMIAGMPSSVVVYELTAEGLASGEPMYCSYFTLIEDVGTAVCLPFAGILGSIGFGLVAIYLVTGKEWLLKGMLGCCFGAMTLAVIPVMVQVDAFLLPNMMVPILLGISSALANVQLKRARNTEEKKEPVRLKKR